MAVGLLEPTQGSLRVFGAPVREDPSAQARVGFMAQDKPLYGDFTVAEMLKFGRSLNPRWDDDLARQRLAELDIPLRRKIAKLSGGQRTQVALTLTLAKRPELLVLDEPLADLDPLARHDVTRGLMAAVAETGMTVLFSSHVVSELENTCDWLVVVNGGRVQVSGDIDDLLAGHRLLTGPRKGADAIAARLPVIQRSDTDRNASLLVRAAEPLIEPTWTARSVSLEDLLLAYLRSPDSASLPRPTLVAS
jgi:ABC-2 type transport system ATP-binding protein